MEKVAWKVEGMTCSNCALTVSAFLQKKGMQEVRVNPINGMVDFTFPDNTDSSTKALESGIRALGYSVTGSAAAATPPKQPWLYNHKRRFLFCLVFTLPLMLHMLPVHIHWLMNPWVQLALCCPVLVVGMGYFGKSAWHSLRNRMPNMNVLVAIGALAAFVYSLIGTLWYASPDYLFYETTASIITLVFLGNALEEASIRSTQRAVEKLASSQQVMAHMIAYDDQHQEQVFPVDNSVLKTGDLILIKTGEQVPADCKILWGECTANEALLTGESKPIFKQKKDILIGGSILETGTIKAQVTAAGSDTVLSGIVQMVQKAQGEKPPVQRLADRISAIFVPVVTGIALITFLLSYFLFDIAPGPALLRAIAVLVISCPCAMGLATPAAIAVGLGRGARNGILYKNAASLELFSSIRQVVFDKTGTLTTGAFTITEWQATDMDEAAFKQLVYSIEKLSNHPIARSLTQAWATPQVLRWKNAEEIKGRGMRVTDNQGVVYETGSWKLLYDTPPETEHQVYVLRNGVCIGWINMADEIRPEAKGVIDWLHQKKIRTILLSGDTAEKCNQLAATLGITTVYAAHSPAQKLERLDQLLRTAPTAMVGDGINDAPALAKASLGISLSDAAQLAVQSADVILMNQGLRKLPMALGLGKHTYRTIQENLFWAFAYNIVAIPVAAMGWLNPTLGALVMGLSDVVLAINSVRLFVKKVDR
jgi:P-type Cu+ transporter